MKKGNGEEVAGVRGRVNGLERKMSMGIHIMCAKYRIDRPTSKIKAPITEREHTDRGGR